MTGKLIFIHGTTVRDTTASMAQIRPRAKQFLGLEDENDVVSIDWGNALGPKPHDITPALPPGYATRGVLDEATVDPAVALWGLLLADPTAELCLLVDRPRRGDKVIVGEESVPVQVAARLTEHLAVPELVLSDAGLSSTQLDEACDSLAGDMALVSAAGASPDPDDELLVEAIARCLVAKMLLAPNAFQPLEADTLPAAAIDAGARDDLVAALVNAQVPLGNRSLAGEFLKSRILGPLATKVAVAKREDFMGPLAHFLHDVTFYLSQGEKLRDFVARGIRQYTGDGPAVVLAHSLGGIVAVDLLSDPATKQGDNPLKVELLVTVGSQAPLLYLMDGLGVYRQDPGPTEGVPRLYVPWLNIYNREDLLSFCAAEVFKDTAGIVDAAVDAGVPFPASHSAYWRVDKVFETIRENLEQ